MAGCFAGLADFWPFAAGTLLGTQSSMGCCGLAGSVAGCPVAAGLALNPDL